MEYRVCFTLANYENNMLSLCETTNVFIDALCYSKFHFHQLGSFKWIKTMFKSLNVCKVYLQWEIAIQTVVTKLGLPSVQLSRMMNLKIKFAKNKYLSTIWSTEMNQIAWTYLARKHYKTFISCDFTIWPPLGSWPLFFNTISTPDCKRRVTQQYLTYLCTDIN